MNCVFCKIVKKEISAQFFYENEELAAFKDIQPSAPVHILVVPKEHVPSIAQLEGKHRSVLADLIYIAKDLAVKQGLRGYKLVFNVGREGGQVIDHLHLHLLGGWSSREEVEAMPHPGLNHRA